MTATTPTAEPCAKCGTTGGAIDRNTARPWRREWLCADCYGPSCAQQQTYPCADCRTTGGHMAEGDSLPMRTRGLCKVCYTFHHRAGTLDRYPQMPQFITRRGRRTRLPAERRRERVAAIAARVARHERAPARAEGRPDSAATIAATEAAAAAWLNTHPHQVATWADEHFAAFVHRDHAA